jgi:CubicO group peptidase (beta-lactamase class C family)
MRQKLSRLNVLTAAGAFVMAVWVAACATAVNPDATDDGTREVADAAEPLENRVASIVKNELLAKGVPAVSVAVMRDGKMLLERGWGAGDIEKNVAASHTTIYPTGSIAKQFTATLLLKQVDRGGLALTDPIGKHLGALPAEAGAVTIEQLLNHTSGLQRAAIVPARRFESVSPEALLDMAVSDKPGASPGARFEYSNAGYTILGLLIEKLYGKCTARHCTTRSRRRSG